MTKANPLFQNQGAMENLFHQLKTSSNFKKKAVLARNKPSCKYFQD